MLRPELRAVLGSARFFREIEIAAQLSHPHIVPLFDSGEAGGFLYFVMPYVEGETLRDRLAREKQLPLDDALQVARGVADALAYAHRLGIVHRDIKPENILLQAGHAGGERLRHRVGGPGARQVKDKLTDPGFAVGTPAYMARSRPRPSPHRPSRRLSTRLGVVALRDARGHAAVQRRTSQEMLAAHTVKPPRAAVAASPGHSAGRCAAVVMRALAKSPADRLPECGGDEAQLEPLTGNSSQGGITPTVAVPAAVVPEVMAPGAARIGIGRSEQSGSQG